MTTDVAVIGDGVIGLSTAFELARAGLRCRILGASRPGAASAAAAGLLAPTIGQLSKTVRALFNASLDLYPEFLVALQEFDPELALITGLIEVVDAEPQAPRSEASHRLSPSELSRIEPSLLAPLGAFLHPRDAAIDNVRLVRALRLAVAREKHVTTSAESLVTGVRATKTGVSVFTASGPRIEAGFAVVAAGVWTPSINGLPRQLPISPLKGQMLALVGAPINRPVMGDDVYLVPRGEETIVGATTERAGFDVTTTKEATEALHAAAARLCPVLGKAAVLRSWAGLRPATPDLLPIVGPEPDMPRLLYASGHSKNGILLAPVTALVLTALAQDKHPPFDLAPFSILRFAKRSTKIRNLTR